MTVHTTDASGRALAYTESTAFVRRTGADLPLPSPSMVITYPPPPPPPSPLFRTPTHPHTRSHTATHYWTGTGVDTRSIMACPGEARPTSWASDMEVPRCEDCRKVAVDVAPCDVAGRFSSKGLGPSRAPEATAAHEPPNRAPDVVAQERTLPHQAALYRLASEDYNPVSELVYLLCC